MPLRFCGHVGMNYGMENKNKGCANEREQPGEAALQDCLTAFKVFGTNDDDRRNDGQNDVRDCYGL